MHVRRLGKVPLILLFSFAASAAIAETSWLGIQLGRDPGGTLPGVPVLQIVEGSPAHAAGLRARDRILAVDGASVASNGELVETVRRHAPGSWIPLTVSRGERELDLRVRLETRPEEMKGLRPLRGWIGVESIDLPASLREYFGAPQNSGVMIAAVAASSPAEAAGFELGDVVYEVDGESVVSPAQLLERVAGAGVGNAVVFRVARRGQELALEAVIETAPVAETQR